MTKPLSLAVFCPNQSDATSLYRGMGPLGLLKKQFRNVNLNFINEVNWSTLSMVDAVFMQRPWLKNHLSIAKLVKRQRVPLWIDFDDALFHIPKWNPAHEAYNKPENQRVIAETIAMADVVTVSTPHLKQIYGKLNKNIIVVPNAWNNLLMPYQETDWKKRQKLICWRGSNTHKKDLSVVAKACMELSNKHPDFTWIFIGDEPWFADYMKEGRVMISPSLDPIDYFDFMQKTAPSIQIVPLVDNDFNRAKSNIAWIESTWAGAISVAPDFEEWHRPGIHNYKTEQDFIEIMDRMMSGKIDMRSAHASSWQYIDENLRLSKTNELRMSVIESLMVDR